MELFLIQEFEIGTLENNMFKTIISYIWKNTMAHSLSSSFVLLIFLSSCVPVHQNLGVKRIYTGEMLPVEKICVVRSAVRIMEIDGEKLDRNDDVIELLPGRHVMKIHAARNWELTGQTVYWQEPVVFTFTYDAGKRYYIDLEKDRESKEWKIVGNDVTDWPEMQFLFENYFKQRATI